MDRDLSGFTGLGYDKGRGVVWQAAWFAVSNLVFKKWWLPAKLRPSILRMFGAKIGVGCLIREDVRIHWPWKLSIGDNVWIGVEAYLLNLECIEIGSNVCVSQRSLVCTGNHDWNSVSLEFRNQPVLVNDGAWITAGVLVAPGSVVAKNEVIKHQLPTQRKPGASEVLDIRAVESSQGNQ